MAQDVFFTAGSARVFHWRNRLFKLYTHSNCVCVCVCVWLCTHTIDPTNPKESISRTHCTHPPLYKGVLAKLSVSTCNIFNICYLNATWEDEGLC